MPKQRAQAVVEFALLAPLLVVLVLTILGIGRAFYTYVDLTSAARAGARCAIAPPKPIPPATKPDDWCRAASPIAQTIAAQPNLSITTSMVTVACLPDRCTVTITNYPFDTFVPGIGTLPLTISATLPR